MRRYLLLCTPWLLLELGSCSVYHEGLLPDGGGGSGGSSGSGGSFTGGSDASGGVPSGGSDPTGGAPSGGGSTGGGSGGDDPTGGSSTGGDASGGGDTGGSDGNGGTTGGGGSGGTGGSGGSPPVTYTYEYSLITSLDTGAQIDLLDGGYWFSAASDDACISPIGDGLVLPEELPSPRTLTGYPEVESRFAMHFVTTSCTGWGGWGSQAGFGLRQGMTNDLGPYDASDYDGIAFWARASSNGQRVRLDLSDVNTHPDGGNCGGTGQPQCHLTFQSAQITISSEWQLFQVFFSDVRRSGMTPNTAQLFQVVFSFSNNLTSDVWIDDVYFFEATPED